MRYRTLVLDYDGTIATGERVSPQVVNALQRVRASGRDLILVTGRELDDLLDVFEDSTLFDRIVAENGAVVHNPATRVERLLGEPPADTFIDDLRNHDVWPLSVGQVIVATWQPHQHAVLDAISRHGLELQVIFNHNAVMVLPSNINKATGLSAALRDMRRSVRNTVCAGDAENDQAMFSVCERSVAVSNAIPSVREHADLVTHTPNGSGVIELIERVLATDLREIDSIDSRHDILVGVCDVDGPQALPVAGTHLLITGEPGSGKSFFATGVIERILERGYQALVIDPEGDYGALPGVIHLGDSSEPPGISDILHALDQPEHSVIVNMLAVPLDERARYFSTLCDGVSRLRSEHGFPHWLVVDEAHHVMPGWATAPLLARENDRFGVVLITVHPDNLEPSLLAAMNTVVVTGARPGSILADFARSADVASPVVNTHGSEGGKALLWSAARGPSTRWMTPACSRSEHRRHLRKYAEGDMGPVRSFYFRGPAASINVRARNLSEFISLAERVDDATWSYHLERHDYSRWVLGTVGDRDLAGSVEAVEYCAGMSPSESRAAIRSAIEQRYTAPG